MDNSFIKGEPVACKIALHKDQEIIKEGDPIIISLSTGSKYKGKIIQVDSLWLKQAAFGEMTVQRVLPFRGIKGVLQGIKRVLQRDEGIAIISKYTPNQVPTATV